MTITPGVSGLPTELRNLLHEVNDELSVAMMELELLLEASDLDAASGEAIAGSLEACRRAATGLKEVWRALGPSGDRG